MGAFVQFHDDFMFLDRDGRRDIEQVAEYLFGLRSFILASDLIGHEAIERTGHEGDLEIEVHFESDHGGKGIEVKELHGLRDAILDKHAVGVASHQRRATQLQLIGQQHGGLPCKW